MIFRQACCLCRFSPELEGVKNFQWAQSKFHTGRVGRSGGFVWRADIDIDGPIVSLIVPAFAFGSFPCGRLLVAGDFEPVI